MAERLPVVLVCDKCGARNYRTTKARKAESERLRLKKFCPTCKQHTVHNESK